MSLEDKVRWAEREGKDQDPLLFLKRHYHAGLTRGELAKQDPSLYQRLRREGLLESVPTADMGEVRKQSSRFGTDPVAYYQEHHAGLTRGQLQKQDLGLYKRLRRDGLLEQVPVSSKFGTDPVAYYQEHYAGLSRGQLKKQDSGLYQRLRKDKFLESVPTADMSEVRKKSSRFGNDPVAYYNEHHAGSTRGELKKQDLNLYQRLWREGLLESVPTADMSKVKKQSSRFGTDPVAYYQQHHAGLTRGELAKQDSGLYERLRREGLLESVPTADMGEVRKQSSRFGNDPVAYYQEHHAGLIRGKLRMLDPGLYERLRRDGLLEQVPIQQEHRDFGNDPLAYYNQHHAGLTRGQLRQQDPSLYKRLRRNGLLENVPVSSKFGTDPVAYYQEHYAGLTRGQLRKQDPSLYKRLRRNGLLEKVPTKSNKKK